MWASTYPTNFNRIVILQKKIVRIISKKPFDAHTEPIFEDLQILKFSNIYLFQIGKFMYSFKEGLLPSVFRNMFSLTSQVHSYITRNSNAFFLFPARTNVTVCNKIPGSKVLQFSKFEYTKCCYYFSFSI